MDIHLSYKFIDEYIPRANGDFLKVYLYILRHDGERPTAERIADALNMTERDVQRAVAYWIKEGVLDAAMYAVPHTTPYAVSHVTSYAAPDIAPEKKEVDIARLSEDGEFRALLHALQNYMNRRFTPSDAETVGYIYDQLGFSEELIEYLFQLCRQKGKTSLRYIETIARSWHSKGISTIEAARSDGSVFASEIGAVKKHMGVRSRDLAESETEYVKRWLLTWKMPADLICEACDRTVISVGKPSFAYADSILKSWHEAGINTDEQLKEHDRLYSEIAKTKAAEKAAERVAGKATGKQTGKPNGFHNFDERPKEEDGIDLDAIAKQRFNDLFK